MMTYKMLEDAIKWMAGEEAERRFKPVLEADLVAFLYHCLLLRKAEPLTAIHVQARVLGSESDKQKFDLVIGDVLRRAGDTRLAAAPELVLEVKILGTDFNASQVRNRLRGAKKDLLRLHHLAERKRCRVAILVWNQPRREGIRSARELQRMRDYRDRMAPGVRILWVTAGGRGRPLMKKL